MADERDFVDEQNLGHCPLKLEDDLKSSKNILRQNYSLWKSFEEVSSLLGEVCGVIFGAGFVLRCFEKFLLRL